ncbi:MAG: hypothetical protein M3Q03_19805 [Chloroflexota bacterium]|nr:hypothetical protein [Chloroflexota bacterium]
MGGNRIRGDDELLRRLAPKNSFKRDRRTPTRGAFKTGAEYDRQISVQVRRLLPNPHDPLTVLGSERRDWGLGSLRAKDVIDLGFSVEMDPKEGDPAHALILGETTQVLADELVECMKIIKYPD